ncbi:hypothetical protein [Gordonia sp. YC-JH1]|uniref:hypothetical protein n=1 Tax=Gordonia sp. YC-JH1 TaxID=2059875 RepID=UPI001F458963|nr:hypothetical protein [Gordonia sp. YC-JH1]
MTSTTAQDWDTAAAVVRDHADALASMGSHSELYSFAKEKNLATKLLFPKFKTELRKQLRIDYDQIRKDTLAARLVELEAAGETAPTITLFCAGDVESIRTRCAGQRKKTPGTEPSTRTIRSQIRSGSCRRVRCEEGRVSGGQSP